MAPAWAEGRLLAVRVGAAVAAKNVVASPPVVRADASAAGSLVVLGRRPGETASLQDVTCCCVLLAQRQLPHPIIVRQNSSTLLQTLYPDALDLMSEHMHS